MYLKVKLTKLLNCNNIGYLTTEENAVCFIRPKNKPLKTFISSNCIFSSSKTHKYLFIFNCINV